MKKVCILHTEASRGWGGQEMRILSEARGMHQRGYEPMLAAPFGSRLMQEFRNLGFKTFPMEFTFKGALKVLFHLRNIVRKEHVQLINTHSSKDSWIAGILGKWMGCPVLRTRHLSTRIRPGINSKILYNTLADRVVTTCQDVVELICRQALLPSHRCCSIPTGVDPSKIQIKKEEILDFRRSIGVEPHEFLVGTVCVMRRWKGVEDLIRAAFLSKEHKHIRWLVVGGGVSEEYFHKVHESLGIGSQLVFTGHLDRPYVAMEAMDVFALLSTGHEGVSQSSLQAAYLKKPLITTSTGGLKQVCIEGKTGLQVPINDPQSVSAAVLRLSEDESLRKTMGENAHELVLERFTLDHTLKSMERIYQDLLA